MKKNTVLTAGIIASALCLAECLNPVGFTPELKLSLEAEVRGEISVITPDAILVIHNHTQTLDISSITVMDNELNSVAGFVAGRPKAGYEKTFYLRPKKSEYELRFTYRETTPNSSPNTSTTKPEWDWGTNDTSPPVPRPLVYRIELPEKGVYHLHFYRKADGSAGLDSKDYRQNALAGDDQATQTDSADEGEGGTDSALSDITRPRYGLLILKNLTKNLDIDYVSFSWDQTPHNQINGEDRLYTMVPGPKRRDQRSILLGPNDWKTVIKYRVKDREQTTAEKTVTVSATGKEFYAYFYQTTAGNYAVSTAWPPVPNDAADGNADPLEILGSNQGRLRIINKSHKSIITATKWLNIEYPTELIPEDDATFVMPAGTGKMQFKIRGGDYGAWFTRTIKPKAVTTVTYTDALETADYYPADGGLIKLENYSGAQVLGVNIIDPAGTGGSLSIPNEDFLPAGPVGRDGKANIIVEGTAHFPITQNKRYLVQVILGTGSARVSVERYEVIQDRIVTIVIRDAEVMRNLNHGANITIHNDSDKEVTSLYITNPADRIESLTVSSDGFTPAGEIRKGNSASVRIASSPALPVVQGRSYQTQITLGPPPYVYLDRRLELYDKDIEIWITQTEVNRAGGGGGSGSGGGGGSGGGTGAFIPVTNIGGVPSTVTTGQTITLTGTVDPANATKKDIVWSIRGTNAVNAAITNTSQFTAGSAGTVTVVATVPGGGAGQRDYTQEFTIQVTNTAPSFIPVTGIFGVPESIPLFAAVRFGVTVNPGDATKRTPVNWQVLNGGATIKKIDDFIFFLSVSSPAPLKLRAVIPGAIKDGAGDYTQDFTVAVSLPSPTDPGPGPAPSSKTIRFIKENAGSSSMFACWIYTMDSRYDKRFNNSHLASGNSGIPVNGAMSYFKPPEGLTLYKDVPNLYNILINKGDHYELDLPSGRYLITWLKTSVAYHYGYDKSYWFVLDIPYHSGRDPIEIKVNTTGPDCTLRF